jgi:predicted ABC-type sugar transport system permease subunit
VQQEAWVLHSFRNPPGVDLSLNAVLSLQLCAQVAFSCNLFTAWAVAAIPAGIGQGIALRERKVGLNGLLGGVLGGLLGGLLFDPISRFYGTQESWS